MPWFITIKHPKQKQAKFLETGWNDILPIGEHQFEWFLIWNYGDQEEVVVLPFSNAGRKEKLPTTHSKPSRAFISEMKGKEESLRWLTAENICC